MTNCAHIVAGFAVIALIGVWAWLLLLFTWPKARRMGLAFVLIAAGFLHSMATKPTLRITWDDYLADNGSHLTNDNDQVVFKWMKTNAALPSTQPLYISKRQNTEDPWVLAATTTVGAFQYDLSLLAATNYAYFVWHEWTPPSPVHTNGVWLGTVIEKARGSAGVDKLLIINGKLERDGKIIAPPEKE